MGMGDMVGRAKLRFGWVGGGVGGKPEAGFRWDMAGLESGFARSLFHFWLLCKCLKIWYNKQPYCKHCPRRANLVKPCIWHE